MKNYYLIFLLIAFFTDPIYNQSQTSCLPISGGIPAGNEAPGCIMCAPVYLGTTDGFAPSAPWANGFPCGTIENNQFLSVIADTSKTITANLFASNCQNGQGAQIIIYDQDFNPVSTCFSSGGTSSTVASITANNLTPGEIYWFMIDGFAGDICDILITTTGVDFGGNLFSGVINADRPETHFLPGTTVCFSIDSVKEASEFYWDIPAGTEIVSQASDLEICVKFNEPGCREVGFFIKDHCFQGLTKYKEITIAPEIPTSQIVKKCKGGAIHLEGVWHVEVGRDTQILQTPNQAGCDSTYFFEILEVDFPEMTAPINDSIPCSNNCLPIDFNIPSGNNFNFNWTTENGEIAGATNLPTANACLPGIYSLSISDQNQNQICRTDIEIKGSSGIPRRPEAIIWEKNVCSRSRYFYEIKPAGLNDEPIWEVTNGIIRSGQGTEKVEIDWEPDLTSGEVCVYFQNGCGIGEKYCENVAITTTPTADFTATRADCFDETFDAEYTGTFDADNQYNWNFSSLNIVTGAGSGPYQLTAPFPDEFEISLIVEKNGCKSEPKTRLVLADTKPEALLADCISQGDSVIFILKNPPPPFSFALDFINGHTGRQEDSLVIVNNLAPSEEVKLRTTATSLARTCEPVQTLIACYALPCPFISLTIPPGIPEFFCPSDKGFYSLKPDINFSSGSNQTGSVSYNGVPVNSMGVFNVANLPFGNFAVEAVYHEDHCFYRDSVFFEKIDTTPVTIECFSDNFINSIAFDWNPIQVDRYLVQLNDGAIISQQHSSLLFTPNSPEEEVKISVQPIDDGSDCIFPPTTKVCKITDLVPVFEKEQTFDIQIIPNPSAGIFKIESDFKIENIEVFAPSGKKILETDSKEIDLTGFPKGVYFFKIKTNGKTEIRRVLIC